MKIIKYPTRSEWAECLKRPMLETESLFDKVRVIIDKVIHKGDRAVLEYEALYDKVDMDSLIVTPVEIEEDRKSVV